MFCEPKGQELNTFICSIFLWIFRHPWDPWGCVHIDLNKNNVRTGCVIMKRSLDQLWLPSKIYTRYESLLDIKLDPNSFFWWVYCTCQGWRKVWKSGVASCNVVRVICPPPLWDRVNWSAKIWEGGTTAPPLPPSLCYVFPSKLG